MLDQATAIAGIVAPIFALIVLGFAAGRSGYLKAATGEGLADYVFRVAIPLLLFRTLATEPLPAAGALSLWGAYFGAIAVVWIVANLLVTRAFGRDRRAGVIAGVSAGFSNLVLLGIPLIERAFGADGLQVLFLIIAVHLPVMMVASTVLMERAVEADARAGVAGVTRPARGSSLARMARSVLLNPLVVGILAGLAWRATGLPISGPGLAALPAQVIDFIGRTTGPVALVALGLSMVRYSIAGNAWPAAAMAALALVVQPAAALALGTLAGLSGQVLTVVVLCAAMPTGVNAWLIASHFRVAQGLAGNAIALAFLGSFVTLPAWLFWMAGRGY